VSERRKQYLINKGYQNRIVAGLVFSIVLVINSVVIVDYFSPVPILIERLTVFQGLLLGLSELVVVLVTYVLGVRMTHRVAGPVYSMAHTLEHMGEGDLSFRIHLRKADYFQDVGEELNESIARLRSRVVEIKATVKKLEAQLPADQPEIVELVAELDRQLDGLKTDGE